MTIDNEQQVIEKLKLTQDICFEITVMSGKGDILLDCIFLHYPTTREIKEAISGDLEMLDIGLKNKILYALGQGDYSCRRIRIYK